MNRRKPPEAPHLGVQVQLLWAGDLHEERCFPRPTRVTFGPLGTFVMPGEVLPLRQPMALLEPMAGGFGLRLDAGDGWLETDGMRRTFAELRQMLAALLLPPVVKLGAGSKAEVCWGAFCFEIAAVEVPELAPAQLHWRDALPLALALMVATLSTVIPLVVGFAVPGDRVQWTLDDTPPPPDREAWALQPDMEPTGVAQGPAPVVALSPRPPQPSAAPEPVAAPARPAAAPPPGKPVALPTKEGVGKIVTEVIDKMAISDAAGPPSSPDGAGLGHAPTGGDILPQTGPSGGRMADEGDADPAPSAGPSKERVVGPAPDLLLPVNARRQVIVVPIRPEVSDTGLSKDQVRTTLQANQGMVRNCYQKGVQRNPELHGTVRVRLVIAPTGEVADARVSESDVADGEVVACIVAAMRQLRFAAAGDGMPTRVVYPAVLQVR